MDASLEVGAVTETVSVTENVQLVTPDTASTFRQISAQELLEVPTSTRSFTHLLSAESGISAELPPVLTNGNGNISPSVNGTRTTSTSLSFNGIDATNLTSNEGSLSNNISPAPETLQEVKLQTSLYDASTGRSGGGNFQLITKSGTNQFHGTVDWYVQRFCPHSDQHHGFTSSSAAREWRTHEGEPACSLLSIKSQHSDEHSESAMFFCIGSSVHL
jgi:hypothetical protein